MIRFLKVKKLKKKKSGDPLMDPPMTPDEMETELLDDRINENLDPRKDYFFASNHASAIDIPLAFAGIPNWLVSWYGLDARCRLKM